VKQSSGKNNLIIMKTMLDRDQSGFDIDFYVPAIKWLGHIVLP
jgi:hypothetical protein